MLENTVVQMDIRILTKMLMLMTNLLKDYMKEVTEHVWSRLTESIFAQYTKINEMIQKEEGPKRKEKAQHALASMMTAIQKHLGYQTTHCKLF
jgi:hypothetical protein